MTAALASRPKICAKPLKQGDTCLCGRCTTRLEFEPKGDRLTHYLFRYPAKFHPPLARKLIELYSEPGQRILDPFCGSGTLLVEAAVAGRHAIGTDIDPVAVFVASAKTRRLQIGSLTGSRDLLLARLSRLERADDEYEHRMFHDLTEAQARKTIRCSKLWVPKIPNLGHWFRWYVVIDLAKILKTINSLHVPSTHRQFFLLCFASIIRNSSNADPIPVSGLEVTSYMKKKDEAGRLVNPFALMARALRDGVTAMSGFVENVNREIEVRVRRADALALPPGVRSGIDAVITSPPYHNAVDYYRRHLLEMFWLRLVDDHEDRLALLPKYIGRSQVRNGHRLVTENPASPLVKYWYEKMSAVSPQRANAFKHYVHSMRDVMRGLGGILRGGSPAVFVVGHSRWQGEELPTSELVMESAQDWFDDVEKLWYPVKNRYMSYQRHNGADISEEHVLVLRRQR